MTWTAQLVIVAVLSSLLACGGATPQSESTPSALTEGVRPAPKISGADAHRLVAAGAVLLDVRSGTEFMLRHIEGARNIPLPELEERASELVSDIPVVVYCVSGARSAKAGQILRAKGFTYVFDLGSMVSY